MRRRFGFAVGIVLVAGLAFGAWRSRAEREAAVDARAQMRDLAPIVRVAEVKPSSPTIDITLPGATLAYANADIYARANGYVEKRNVDIGDRVKAGDVLALLSAPELDYQIAQAEGALSQAQATIRQSEANQKLAGVTNARSSVLVRQGWVTAQQGDTDRFNFAAQQAALGAAQASEAAQTGALKALRQQRDYLKVVAPFDGVVTSRAVDTGSLVQSGQTLMFNLQQTTTIRVQVNVPQDQAFGLAPGDAVSVRIPELPGQTFAGRITRISGALQQGTRTLLAEADVPNPDGVLKAGAYCLVDMKIPRRSAAVLIPSEALIFNRDGLQVAVIENGETHLRKITQSRDFGASVEASAGVSAGDKVVLNPMVDLAEGQKVRIAETAGK